MQGHQRYWNFSDVAGAFVYPPKKKVNYTVFPQNVNEILTEI